MTQLEAAQLRLECLKLALQLEGTYKPELILSTATDFWTFVKSSSIPTQP